MLEIAIPERELWDEANQHFIYVKPQTLRLEHSLVSLSKWEFKYCKPYLTKEEKTVEETLYYIKCMTLNQNVDPNVYLCLTNDDYKQILKYIRHSATATTFSNISNKNGTGEQITAELIYYWMITLGIPVEFRKWHLNRLLTLIRVCEIKNQPSKKMSKKDTLSRYAELNAARRKKYNSKG